jgi:hypothetical protein
MDRFCPIQPRAPPFRDIFGAVLDRLGNAAHDSQDHQHAHDGADSGKAGKHRDGPVGPAARADGSGLADRETSRPVLPTRMTSCADHADRPRHKQSTNKVSWVTPGDADPVIRPHDQALEVVTTAGFFGIPA